MRDKGLWTTTAGSANCSLAWPHLATEVPMSDATRKAYEQIDEWVESAKRRADGARAMQDALARRHVSAQSRDGHVRLTVDWQGLPRSLEIDDEAMSGRGEHLAATILDTLRQAQSQMAEQIAGLAVSTFGQSSPDAEVIARSYEQRLRASGGGLT